MHFKMSSTKWRPFCLSLSVLNHVSKRGRRWLLDHLISSMVFHIHVHKAAKLPLELGYGQVITPQMKIYVK